MTCDAEAKIRQEVREFYDRVGWRQVSEGVYQNARYEDLRPVSSEYIHRCHLRIARYLHPSGRFMLDAGSGPIQYPEYLSYSQSYQRRVCLDISIVALQEARQRIGEHGLFVVGDVANLPFKPQCFDGVVSLHTIHHVPFEQQPAAYQEQYRVLIPGRRAVVVNGWKYPLLSRRLEWLVKTMEFAQRVFRRLFGRKSAPVPARAVDPADKKPKPTGTYTRHFDAASLKRELALHNIPVEIRVWRSVSTRFLRAVIHPALCGRLLLRWLFWLEEKHPYYFGENGQYPLIIIIKD